MFNDDGKFRTMTVVVNVLLLIGECPVPFYDARNGQFD